MSLALDLARAASPAVLADAIGMEPDAWQDDVLSSDDARILLNCHRQSGKSTTAAVLGVHGTVYRARSLALIFSPSMRQSREVLQTCVTLYRSLGRPVLAEAENALSLILENGSRIISLPGSEATVRGYAGVDLVIIDEASRVKDELVAAVRPMLAVSGGRLIGMSTPRGRRGWWWDAWENGGAVWKRVRVPACRVRPNGTLESLTPRISAAFLEEERHALGERLFAQEYMCEFVETTDQAFGVDAVKAAFSRDLEPLRFDPSGSVS